MDIPRLSPMSNPPTQQWVRYPHPMCLCGLEGDLGMGEGQQCQRQVGTAVVLGARMGLSPASSFKCSPATLPGHPPLPLPPRAHLPLLPAYLSSLTSPHGKWLLYRKPPFPADAVHSQPEETRSEGGTQSPGKKRGTQVAAVTGRTLGVGRSEHRREDPRDGGTMWGHVGCGVFLGIWMWVD